MIKLNDVFALLKSIGHCHVTLFLFALATGAAVALVGCDSRQVKELEKKRRGCAVNCLVGGKV